METPTIDMMSDDELLLALKNEREKFTQSDKELMEFMVDILAFRGVYNTTEAMKEHGYSFLKMVESWGAYWHTYEGRLNCPLCDSDLRHPSGPPFKREIGIVINDRCNIFRCPDCNECWNYNGEKV